MVMGIDLIDWRSRYPGHQLVLKPVECMATHLAETLLQVVDNRPNTSVSSQSKDQKHRDEENHGEWYPRCRLSRERRQPCRQHPLFPKRCII